MLMLPCRTKTGTSMAVLFFYGFIIMVPLHPHVTSVERPKTVNSCNMSKLILQAKSVPNDDIITL